MCIRDSDDGGAAGGAEVGTENVAVHGGSHSPAGTGQGGMGSTRAAPYLQLALVAGGLRALAEGVPLADGLAEGVRRPGRERAVIQIDRLVAASEALDAADHRREGGGQSDGGPSVALGQAPHVGDWDRA
eukprot:9403914-Alexandrium_andersonii.AAC.1